MTLTQPAKILYLGFFPIEIHFSKMDTINWSYVNDKMELIFIKMI